MQLGGRREFPGFGKVCIRRNCKSSEDHYICTQFRVINIYRLCFQVNWLKVHWLITLKLTRSILIQIYLWSNDFPVKICRMTRNASLIIFSILYLANAYSRYRYLCAIISESVINLKRRCEIFRTERFFIFVRGKKLKSRFLFFSIWFFKHPLVSPIFFRGSCGSWISLFNRTFTRFFYTQVQLAAFIYW